MALSNVWSISGKALTLLNHKYLPSHLNAMATASSGSSLVSLNPKNSPTKTPKTSTTNPSTSSPAAHPACTPPSTTQLPPILTRTYPFDHPNPSSFGLPTHCLAPPRNKSWTRPNIKPNDPSESTAALLNPTYRHAILLPSRARTSRAKTPATTRCPWSRRRLARARSAHPADAAPRLPNPPCLNARLRPRRRKWKRPTWSGG
jgi:hypothetical protein